ncbi:hypothetical protein [Veronia pacifica]|uniref:Uncharacterized protein n=1 Tax=Veronia pacifica TaxID=1080227 RepID=A0A1C3EI64_9GAMM|nr:hypothetical protein [Veronia pacifica]ODA32920.1 hypothetical protein A8L45_12355 [Veronia pacifica]
MNIKNIIKYKVISLFFSLLISTSLQANEVELVLDAVSHHVNATAQFTEHHNAFGAGYKNIEVMTFINSFGVRSYAGDLNIQHSLVNDHLWVGLKVGAVYGYGGIERYPDVMPYVAPYVKGYMGGLGVSMMALPSYGQKADAVVIFMARLRLNLQ